MTCRTAFVLTLLGAMIALGACGGESVVPADVASSAEVPAPSSETAASPTVPEAAPVAVTESPTTTLVYPSITNPIDVEDGSYTLGELTAKSNVIAHGSVTDVVSLGRPDIEEDPYADEFVGVTIKVLQSLKGDSIDLVQLAWPAFNVNARGERVMTWVANGVRTPEVGDEMLLFLLPVDEATSKHLEGFPTYAPVSLDGVAYLSNGRVVEVEVGSPAGSELLGMTTAEASNRIQAG